VEVSAVDIEELRQGAVTVLRPKGALTEAEAPDFASRIRHAIAATLGRVVLDAGAVPFVDSRGLETMVDIAEELGDSGLSLRVCNLNETLREVMDLTGTASLFEHHEDATSAVRSFL
jgi:anti-anti-sigma factor